MRIALSADHAGVDLKDQLVTWLKDQNYEVSDLGTQGHDSVDYPDYGARLARAIKAGDATRAHALELQMLDLSDLQRKLAREAGLETCDVDFIQTFATSGRAR